MGRIGLLILALALICGRSPAATLPAHDTLRILIVSDEVNPHGLPPGDLTQPGELTAALLDPGSGLNLDPAADGVVEVGTNQIEQATALLSVPQGNPGAYDVLIYFAHRIPNNGNDAAGRQAAFDAAVEDFLEDGGGVVSFHHGAYLTGGKETIQGIIGASATGSVPWNTVDGQNVINVAPGHFVTTNGVSYTGTVNYSDPGRGVALDDYDFFNNTPDERYINFEINPGAGDFDLLFGSDYNQNGTSHLLGFTHHRPDWQALVVGYQPGEYQPNALNVAGVNFQILANAIVFSAGALQGGEPLLSVDRGAGTDLELSWTGGQPVFGVYESLDAATVTDPANRIANTARRSRTVTPPATDLLFYRILQP